MLLRTPTREPTTPQRTPHRNTPIRYTAAVSNDFLTYHPDKEPVKAYLRIRPKPPHYESIIEEPYLQIVNDLEISMTPPEV